MKTILRRRPPVTTALLASLIQLSNLIPQPAPGQSPTADDFNPAPNGAVDCLAVQADGKVLVGGGFISTLDGQARPGLGRLNADGTLDGAFNPGSGWYAKCLAVLTDGRIVVGGTVGATGMGRLDSDGTPDGAFKPGAQGSVYTLAVQADGNILVGGTFSRLGGAPCNCLGRVHPDGTLDSGFAGGIDNSGYLNSLTVQPDGKVLLGGLFASLDGQPRFCIGRVDANGSLDSAFNSSATRDDTGDPEVISVAVQADGKIVVGGGFKMLCGQPRVFIGRLNADGTLDSAFNPGADGGVQSLALQTDGKILVGGEFSTLCGQPRPFLGRLNADGTLDSAFNAGADGVVQSLALQADGKILAGGSFTHLAGQPRGNLGRLNNATPATQSLSFADSTLTWLRSGSNPEVWRTTFEVSTNASDWTLLGQGSRITGGWQLAGASISPGGIVRARGFVSPTTGRSDWFVEAYYGRVILVSQPGDRTNAAATTATFQVVASGTAPLNYQWLKDGAPLADGGKVTGAGTAGLTLTGVLRADAAGYSVVVSNVLGSVTSAVARLTVIDPVISAQPVGQVRDAGQDATFNVTAAGTAPLAYQWLNNGAVFAGATGAALTFTNLRGGDAGDYSVVVSNQYGSVTSSIATLVVHFPDAALRAFVAAGGTVAIDFDATVALTSTIPVTVDTVLDAAGHQVMLSGSNAVRLFYVATNVHFTVINLTIANGWSQSGAGILNDGGTLALRGVSFVANSAVGLGGSNVVSEGGALLNRAGTVSATDCWFSGNAATNTGLGACASQGGAVANEGGQMNLSNCVFVGNTILATPFTSAPTTGQGAGGAIYNSGSLAVSRCTFSSNSVTGGQGVNGDWSVELEPGTGLSALGGAICNSGVLALAASAFIGNSVAAGPGGSGWSYYDYEAWGGPGAPGGWAGGGALCSTGPATLTGCTFAGNAARVGGGGEGGMGGFGTHNTFYPGGDGAPGGNATGGAVSANGWCWMTNCTVANNLAAAGAGGPGGPSGGGTSGGSGGKGGAGGSAAGGGVWFSPTNSGYLVNCTLAWNAATAGAGGGGGTGSPFGADGSSGSASGLSGPGPVLINTILATNQPANCSGSVTDGGHNLSSDASAAFAGPGSLNNTDPLLGPLAGNGGPTLTIALLPGSPAIDAGNTAAAPPTDQRGFARFGTADIGAYEFWPPILQISSSPAGGYAISANGPAGQSCQLLTSMTLSNWTAFATNQVAADGTVSFHLGGAGDARRFFRLVIP